MIVMTVGLLACWAAEPLESKTLEVALDLSPESTITWYDFGFSSTQVGSGKEETPVAYEPTEIDHIALVLESGADADAGWPGGRGVQCTKIQRISAGTR